MLNLKDRDTQTKIKHEILQEYLIKWGSIITSGIKGYYLRMEHLRPQFKARFVYVDYFSYTGEYKENNSTVHGSPVLGIKALDEIQQHFITQTNGLNPSRVAILFEEDKHAYQGLLETLKNLGYENRVKTYSDFTKLHDGDIAVINDDSSKYVDQILKFIDVVDITFSFHFIDPYGVKGLDRKNLEKIVAKKRADCIINLMVQPISRFIGSASQDTTNRTLQSYANDFDKLFGSNVWKTIADDVLSGKITREEANRALVNAVAKILHQSDGEITVKDIPLKFQDREQTIYNLLLTTRDPTGAFTMNEILADARIREYDYRVEKRKMKTNPNTPMFNFMDDLTDVKRPSEPDIDFLAQEIYAKCKKQTMTFKDILYAMTNTAFFLKDVRDALTKLKQQKQITFEKGASSLVNRSEVKFL